MADEAKLWVNRGEANEEGEFFEYIVPSGEGMVVLDAIHWIQQNVQPDLAARWNCKAAKCGSCSAEINGKPGLMCKTRLSDFPEDEAITVEPMRAFPRIRDLVTDVSWNYEVNKRITPFTPPQVCPRASGAGSRRTASGSQEFRKCIECFLCMDTCHVLRNHETEFEFIGPALPGPQRQPGDAPARLGRPQGVPQVRRAASATATSTSAAPTSARSTSRSPTTPSSRSRSASPTSTTTRSAGCGARSAAIATARDDDAGASRSPTRPRRSTPRRARVSRPGRSGPRSAD